jgi:methionyl-tRNA synthetase
MGMEGLDAWITGNYGEDGWITEVCPKCGANSEDFIELGGDCPQIEDYDWECHECGALLHERDLMNEREWVADNDPRIP